ncbi:hypothetical protein [Paenibacillus sp. MMO-177]|uniref:hypothetical protein n=1 Tax=Paenibacillus sp. MMO-177 TaxID=3081289 RepID=UPI003017AA05
MRKLFLIVMLISSVVLLVVGCSQGQSSPYGTPVPIKNLKWGMNEEEVMNALTISEKDITKVNTGLAHNDQINFNNQIKLFDHSAEVSLTFSYHILIGITAQFKAENVADVEKAITKERGTGIYKYNGRNEKAEVTWADDILENNKTWKAVVEEIYKNLGIKVSDDPMKDGISVGQMPITSWNLTIDKNSPRYGNMLINGDAAAMLNYPEKYTPELILK